MNKVPANKEKKEIWEMRRRRITKGMGVMERYRKPYFRIERNIPRRVYAGLMNIASVLVGNSSSGLLEAPSFKLPSVNIGNRQRDRFRGNNVIDVGYKRDEVLAGIKKAVDPGFRDGLAGLTNPYGDGHASEKIVERLKQVEISDGLLRTRFHESG
ncbi:UDP-N-acetylglucosamine 2-epimerase [candidate division TA06 bacterium]|nr:UDP-N-acetylglucosamine 2-epimerase [candidate division TA06 bacterium]